MKNIITLLLITITISSFSQKWTTILQQDIGMNAQYFRLDKATNSVWLANTYLGLKKINNGTISNLYNYDDIAGLNVLTAVNDVYVNNDTVYGVDDFDGLFRIENNNYTVLSANITRGVTISKGPEDSLWISASGASVPAFYSFKGNNYNFFNTINSGVQINVSYSVLKDSYNRLWCTYWNGSNGFGISQRKLNSSWDWDNSNNSNLPTYHAKKIIEDNEGSIWVITKKGLCKYDEVLEDWIVYDKSNTNLPSECITEIDFDSQGRTWIIMEDTALAYSYNHTNWVIFDETNSPIEFGDGLPKQLLIDTLDNVWVKDWYDIRILGSNGWLSTSENEVSTSIILYPNPSQSVLNINGVPKNTTYTIYSISGQQQLLNQLTNNKINIAHLAKGTYFLHIKNELGVEVKKFIRE